MKRLDIIIPHERVGELNEVLHKHNVGGITFYDIISKMFSAAILLQIIQEQESSIIQGWKL